MKKLTITTILLLLAGPAWAQPAGLVNTDVRDETAIEDPARAAESADGRWFAFGIPVLAGTRSPCCWDLPWNGRVGGKWVSGQSIGCSLGRDHESFGTHSESPPTDRVIVYVRMDGKEPQAMRLAGENCPVDGNGAGLDWIGDVEEAAGLNWLETVAGTAGNEEAADLALYALSLHRSPLTIDRLHAMALDPELEHRDEAIFWLGARRDGSGQSALMRLLDELPRDDEAWEQIVFAISELPDGAGSRILLDLATDSGQARELRRQALFWLAHSGDEDSVAALVDLLTQ
jgi:hypothetical protein